MSANHKIVSLLGGISLLLLWVMGFYPWAQNAQAEPLPQLTLEMRQSTVNLSQPWPVQFTLSTAAPLNTCQVTDWTSRVVWTVKQVGKGTVTLDPVVVQQTPVSLLPPKAYVLQAGHPIRFSVNLRQYQPRATQPTSAASPLTWQPGMYRVYAKVALCTPEGQASSTPQWVSNKWPLYLYVQGPSGH
jgi:hypothetical protein